MADLKPQLSQRNSPVGQPYRRADTVHVVNVSDKGFESKTSQKGRSAKSQGVQSYLDSLEPRFFESLVPCFQSDAKWLEERDAWLALDQSERDQCSWRHEMSLLLGVHGSFYESRPKRKVEDFDRAALYSKPKEILEILSKKGSSANLDQILLVYKMLSENARLGSITKSALETDIMPMIKQRLAEEGFNAADRTLHEAAALNYFRQKLKARSELILEQINKNYIAIEKLLPEFKEEMIAKEREAIVDKTLEDEFKRKVQHRKTKSREEKRYDKGELEIDPQEIDNANKTKENKRRKVERKQREQIKHSDSRTMPISDLDLEPSFDEPNYDDVLREWLAECGANSEIREFDEQANTKAGRLAFAQQRQARYFNGAPNALSRQESGNLQFDINQRSGRIEIQADPGPLDDDFSDCYDDSVQQLDRPDD